MTISCWRTQAGKPATKGLWCRGMLGSLPDGQSKEETGWRDRKEWNETGKSASRLSGMHPKEVRKAQSRKAVVSERRMYGREKGLKSGVASVGREKKYLPGEQIAQNKCV